MTVDELVTFRSFIGNFLRIIKPAEDRVNSKMPHIREKAARELDFWLPKLRSITLFGIKKFCNESVIKSNNAFLASLRVDILLEVRKHVDVPLPRMYYKVLRTTKN